MNPSDQTENDNNKQWSYTSGNLVEEGTQVLPAEQPQTTKDEVLLTWSASEFVEHDKTNGWYVTLAVGAIFLAIVLYLITKQVLSAIVVILMAIMFGIYGAAKPKVLDYTIMTNGLMIGNKVFVFNTIKSFSVISESGMPYIQLMLQKKLSVPVIIYAAPDQIEQVADVLGKFVPYDQKKRDIADKISSRIRF